MPYAAADAPFACLLGQRLGAEVIEPAPPAYLEEPRGKMRRQGAALLARPRDTGEVAAILAACNEAGVAVVPWSGGTGLVGGQVMAGGPAPLILSLERMNRIRAVDPGANVMVAEAGVILADVRKAAQDAGRLFPLSLAAEGSCRIGGNLATNAGGVQVLSYGNARDLCLGVEAVLADGTIVRGLSGLRKDNTGYDLRHLLIGSEGTLGVITAASLRLFPAPSGIGTAFLATASPQAALDLFHEAQAILGGRLTAFELIDATGIGFVAEHLPQVRIPLDPVPKWSVLIEAAGPADTPDALEAVLGSASEAGAVGDGVIAANAAQRAAIWALREAIPEANRRVGAIASHDIALTLGAVPQFISDTTAELASASDVRVNCFGHLGDGNLHFNLFPREGLRAADYAAEAEALSGLILARVHALGGSFSAEHGVGRFRMEMLERMGDPGKLVAMRAIKAALDPNGILNPGAVLRGA